MTLAYMKEFMSFVVDKFNVSFFSSTVLEKVNTITESILTHHFNESRPDHVKLFSIQNTFNTDCTPNRYIWQPQPKEEKYMWYGRLKKDITKCG